MQILINQLGFFAPSLFALIPTYANNAVSWIKGSIITKKEDLSGLPVPHFYKLGLLPLVHHMANRPILLMFPLRGPKNLAMDLLDVPPFVHEMMGFATHCMKTWRSDRARFLNKRLAAKHLFRVYWLP
jgi:hypothetical protein